MSANTEEALALGNEIADAFRGLRDLPQRKSASAARLLRSLSIQVERCHSEIFYLRDEAATLRKQMDMKIADFLAEKACCDGRDCGCGGITRLEQYLAEKSQAQRKPGAS